MNLKPVTDSDPSVILTVGGLRNLLREEIKAVLAEKNYEPNIRGSANANGTAAMPYLSVKEAAQLSGFGVSTIRLYINRGLLKRCQIKSRRIVIARAELERFLGAAPA